MLVSIIVVGPAGQPSPTTTGFPSSSSSSPSGAGTTPTIAPTPSPNSGPGLGPTTHLGAGEAVALALLTAVTAAVIGMIMLRAGTGWLFKRPEPRQGAAGNTASTDGDDDRSIVRAWLAIILVVGLLIFGSMAFALDDAQLRSGLIGGLVASAGSAIAYYFSSKNADSARKDILGAMFQMATVPDVTGMTVDNARAKVESLGLMLTVHPGGAAGTVQPGQMPTAGSSVRRGDAVHVDVA
jgi:hypothetical protein